MRKNVKINQLGAKNGSDWKYLKGFDCLDKLKIIDKLFRLFIFHPVESLQIFKKKSIQIPAQILIAKKSERHVPFAFLESVSILFPELPILIYEAMKMENEICALKSVLIKTLGVHEGDNILAIIWCSRSKSLFKKTFFYGRAHMWA